MCQPKNQYRAEYLEEDLQRGDVIAIRNDQERRNYHEPINGRFGHEIRTLNFAAQCIPPGLAAACKTLMHQKLSS